MARTQTCIACTSYAYQLIIANARHDALNEAMTKVENDTIVSTKLANQREQQQMSTNKSEAEASILKPQGKYELLQIKALNSEQKALHARSELEQATESSFCFDSAHALLQEDLDPAHCEITELRTTETTLDRKITALKGALKCRTTLHQPWAER